MSDYIKIEPENLDHSVLEKITDEQIVMWFACKLNQLRATGIPVSSVGLTCHNFQFLRKDNYSLDWNIHAADKCSGTSPSIARAMESVRESLLNNPRKRADEARWKAKELLKEAEELEALAK